MMVTGGSNKQREKERAADGCGSEERERGKVSWGGQGGEARMEGSRDREGRELSDAGCRLGRF